MNPAGDHQVWRSGRRLCLWIGTLAVLGLATTRPAWSAEPTCDAPEPGLQRCVFSDGLERWRPVESGSDVPLFFRFLASLHDLVLPSPDRLPFGKSIALLVGVSDYKSSRHKNQRYSDLPFVKNDLRLMRETLLRHAGFDEVNVLTGDDVTSKKLKTVLSGLRTSISAKDRFMFYFSGHGDDLLNTQTGIMVFSGHDPQDPANDYFFKLRDLKDWSGYIDARHMLFLLDSCSSGLLGVPQTRKGETGDLLDALSGSGSRIVVTAGTAGQNTYENDGNGVFTRAFVDSMLEVDESKISGFRTVSEIVAEAEKKIAAFASQHPKEVDALTPDIWRFHKKDYDGTFVFIYPEGKLSPAEQQTLALKSRGRDTAPLPPAFDARALELAFWNSIDKSADPADFEDYLARYPDGAFSGLAKRRLAALTKVAALPPAAPTPGFTATEMDETYYAVKRSNIRAGPGTEFDKVGRLSPGDEIEVTGKVAGKNWYRIAMEDGKEAFVFASLLSERKPAEKQLAVGVFPNAGRQPGDTFKDCPECPEMVVVPAGSFLMGSPNAEEGRKFDEGPLHPVTISRPFAVGIYEVTFDQWDACVAGGGCNGHRANDRGWGRGPRPVFKVSWDDAKAYVRWLGGKTRQAYRLPSEAEWEYVARAGTSTAFSTGSTIGPDQANYDGNFTYGSGRKGIYRHRTVPVGSFSSNVFGLHDVHGNLWEWTEDCWHDGYQGAPDHGGAWTTGGECDKRVFRGGSFAYGPRDLRSARRLGLPADFRYLFVGFRVARTLTADEIAETLETQTAALAPAREASIEVAQMDATFVALKTSNLRAEPTVESERIGRLSRDDSVAVTGKVKDKSWYRIDYQGRTAFVFGTLIKEIDAGELAAWEKVVGASDRADVEKFLRGYPNGHFAERAKALRAALVPPPAPVPADTPVQPAVGAYPKAYRPGEAFQDCPECPEMVVIPPGRFRMGDLSGGGDDTEKPVHAVKIGYKFAVGKYEVTFDEWEACVAGGGCYGYQPMDEGWGRGDRPVIDVSWDDAKAYVNWLRKETGKKYRLLSEAEWEYAARAGTTSQFSTGRTITPDQANFGGYSYGGKTLPVGSFAANGFGLHDVHGNVWEWVEDCWHDSYAGAPLGGVAWTTGFVCSQRVFRGGSWYNNSWGLRSAFRSWAKTGRRKVRLFATNGFRVARTL